MPKTARITFLSTPEFKQMLEDEARSRHVSVGELIRGRFSTELTDEEIEVRQLAVLLTRETEAARASLTSAITEAQEVLSALRLRREERERKAV
ncbi:MAG: hypothetical protein HY900_19350 [Deltaproteobacteria bacterium]|nr:hypothetical protein [Deltaproteobacteria bacterium]